jgi:formate/nitrite transporter FocA (FNT family)
MQIGPAAVGLSVSAGLGVWIAIHLYASCKASYVVSALMAGVVVAVDFVLGLYTIVLFERSLAPRDVGIALLGYLMSSLVFAAGIIALAMLCLGLTNPVARLIHRLRR